ncbi:MAG: ankyrin repeat domain-containing protein [Geminicoccaceae bacterium]
MRIVVFGLSILLGTMAVASCGEYEVGGKTAADLFPNEQVAVLARAAAAGDIAAIDQAVADGVDVNAVGIDDATPLAWATGAQNKDGFKQLLKHGADPYFQPEGFYSVVQLAAGAEDPAFLEILLDQGLDPNRPTGSDQYPPIFTAIIQHRWPQLELLLAHCYDLNWANDFGRTAAVRAASVGEMKMAVHLLEQGMTHNLPRLALAAQGRVGNVNGQQDAQQKLIAMLRERSLEFPPDPIKGKEILKNPPPPSPPAYAESCRERRKS